jgi:hypothetical protein
MALDDVPTSFSKGDERKSVVWEERDPSATLGFGRAAAIREANCALFLC